MSRGSWRSGICGSPTSRSRSGSAQADKLWVVSGTTGFSRFHGGWMVPTRAAHDVRGGMLRVLVSALIESRAFCSSKVAFEVVLRGEVSDVWWGAALVGR
jgi:hypothetical protein